MVASLLRIPMAQGKDTHPEPFCVGLVTQKIFDCSSFDEVVVRVARILNDFPSPGYAWGRCALDKGLHITCCILLSTLL